MATIRQLKSGNWNVQVRISGKASRSQTLHSREAADEWAINEELRLNYHHADLMGAGLAYCEMILGGKPSQKLSEFQMRRFGKRGEFAKPIDKITLQDIHSYKQKRLIEVSATTVRDDLMMLRRIFSWYISEWLARTGKELPNPCDRLTLPKARKVRETVVTRHQLELLLREMTPLTPQDLPLRVALAALVPAKDSKSQLF